jgi:hypothetical protein
MTNQLNAGCKGLRGDLPREAFGVRGACSRFGTRGNGRKRQQAGRTPNASRDLVAPLTALRDEQDVHLQPNA